MEDDNLDTAVQVRLDKRTIKRIDKAKKKTDADSRSQVIRVGAKKYLDELGV